MQETPLPLIEFLLFLALVAWLVFGQRRRSDGSASGQTRTNPHPSDSDHDGDDD